MISLPDTELITRVIADDNRKAFSELIRRHQSGVRNLLRKLTCGNHFLADDLAQDTFIRAFGHLKNFKGNAAFSTWLYRIAYNLFISDSRCSKSLEEEQIDNKNLIIEEPGIDQILLKIDIEKAMIILNKKERAALSLCFWKNMTHPEAAGVLDCPVGTVKTLIAQGKKKLRKKLVEFEKEVLDGRKN